MSLPRIRTLMRRRGSVLDAARRWTASARRRRVGALCARTLRTLGSDVGAAVDVPWRAGVSGCTDDIAAGGAVVGVRPAAVAARPVAVALYTKLVTAPTYGRAAAPATPA